jgi:hypothetical protein
LITPDGDWGYGSQTQNLEPQALRRLITPDGDWGYGSQTQNLEPFSLKPLVKRLAPLDYGLLPR